MAECEILRGKCSFNHPRVSMMLSDSFSSSISTENASAIKKEEQVNSAKNTKYFIIFGSSDILSINLTYNEVDYPYSLNQH